MTAGAAERRRILVVDDDRALAEMLGEYLERAGYVVIARDTVAEGFTAARRESFDAVILDVMLPDGDGLDLCRRLRAESDVPILMLTARGDPPDRIVGLEIGADDYLPKPFNPRELLARLRADSSAGARGRARGRRRFVSEPSRSTAPLGWCGSKARSGRSRATSSSCSGPSRPARATC